MEFILDSSDSICTMWQEEELDFFIIQWSDQELFTITPFQKI